MAGSARRERLAAARLYLCTPIRPDLADFAEAVCGAGVDVIQLRDKEAEAVPLLEAAAVLRAAADRHGALLAVNDRADVALDAAAEGWDYFAVGPVFPTATKPGRPAVGASLLREVAAMGPAAPWFAIGGIDRSNLVEVAGTGVTRIVVVRAITGAADPSAAAAQLRRLLEETG